MANNLSEMMANHASSDEGGGAPEWMVTFGDLMSLLLTFFILLLSFSNMDVVKYRQMLGSMKDAFGVQKADATALEKPTGSLFSDVGGLPGQDPNELKIKKIMQELKKLVKEERLEHMVNIERKERGVLMRIKGELMFRSGDAHVRYTFQKTLRKISKAIEKVDNQIIVEGHTDDLPIRTGRFPSNWELSSARAGAVVRYLSQNPKIDAKRFTAVGYADTKPIVPNTNAINRSKNRRVELLFVDNKSKEKGESE